MINLLTNDIKVNIKKIIIATFTISFLVFASMFFYSTIAENFTMFEDFFQAGIMKSVFTAFGINAGAMQSILGFYATYSSMFVVLFGSILFGFFGAELIAKEEKEGTVEYLLARPINRGQLFAAKYLALFIYVLIFILILGSMGWLAIELNEKHAVIQLNMAKHTTELEAEILHNSEEISSWLQLSEDDFNECLYTVLFSEYQANQAEIAEHEIKREDINILFEKLLESPEKMFSEVKQNPSKYMLMFNAEDISEAEFLLEVEKSEKEYQELKTSFLTSNDVVGDYYSMAPSFFLNKIKDTNKIDELDNLLNGTVMDMGLFAKYDLNKFIVLHVNMFLIILVIASLSFAFSAIVKGEVGSSQIVMVVILIMYFINSFSGISTEVDFLKYLTPFGYIDTDVSKIDYGVNLLNSTIIITLCAMSFAVGYLRYQKKDF